MKFKYIVKVVFYNVCRCGQLAGISKSLQLRRKNKKRKYVCAG